MKYPVLSVIMAGGSGERFWPVSRRLRPKQLLCLTDPEKCMLEEAIERILPLVPSDKIFIASNVLLQQPLRDALDQIPHENILCEPMRRNTAGCLVYAAAHALARWGDEAGDLLMAVTTADHRIGDLELFQDTVQAALNTAAEHDALVVMGIKPTRVETGYGYIEIAESGHPISSENGIEIYPAASFREKPKPEDAERYVQSGRFYWNSGMFFWKISTFINALQIHAPELARGAVSLANAMQRKDEDEVKTIFEQLPDKSIDYALMEKAENVYMAVGEFTWDDVGAWDSLTRLHPADAQGNVALGDPVLIDCRNVTVYNEPGAEKMAVGIVGMENIMVVASEDGILICPKDRAQDVRKVVDDLKLRKAKQL